jgi:hypothetical protein
MLMKLKVLPSFVVVDDWEGLMDAQNDFFTWQSLATFAGTTTATTAVTNGLRQAFATLQTITWLGLLVAIVLCVGVATIDVSSGNILFARPFATYFIAVVNGFFVFASAAGLSAGGAAILHGAAADGATPRGNNGTGPDRGAASGFWQRWF